MATKKTCRIDVKDAMNVVKCNKPGDKASSCCPSPRELGTLVHKSGLLMSGLPDSSLFSLGTYSESQHD